MNKIKNLLVSGCSFTANKSWAYFFAQHHGLDLINLAVPGAGNQHISKSIILYLETNKLSFQDTLIVVMWSGITRRDWIREYNSEFDYLYGYYRYFKNLKLVIPSDALRKSRKKFGQEAKLTDALDLAYGPHMQAHVVESWLAIDHLNNYLRNRQYRYVQTTFYDPTQDMDQRCPFRGINYKSALSSLPLTIEYDNFLDLAHDEYLGNYAFKNNLILSDYHPTEKGHEQWCQEILIDKISNI